MQPTRCDLHSSHMRENKEWISRTTGMVERIIRFIGGQLPLIHVIRSGRSPVQG